MLRHLRSTYYYFANYYSEMKKMQASVRSRCCFRVRRIVLWGGTDDNNLGDHAISYAIKDFCTVNFPDAEFCEFQESDIRRNINDAVSRVCDDDIIVLVGGGNLGDCYPDQRVIRNSAIRLFPHNTVIIFPQSAEYSRSLKGRWGLNADRRIFRRHADLHIFARDPISFEIMQKDFSGSRVYCVPDIVLSLRKYKNYDRSGGILCIRNDGESNLDQTEKEGIFKTYSQFKTLDTVLKYDISASQRSEYLDKIWTAFAHAEFVITDRLHGMIFAVITGTPYVVLSNSNHKIRGAMRWLSECRHVYMAENGDGIAAALKRVCGFTPPKWSHADKFEPLKNLIQEKLN